MMLVLTRHLGEAIVIGGNCLVRVLYIEPGRVKLGFEAPASIHIIREELLNRYQGVADGKEVDTEGHQAEGGAQGQGQARRDEHHGLCQSPPKIRGENWPPVTAGLDSGQAPA